MAGMDKEVAMVPKTSRISEEYKERVGLVMLPYGNFMVCELENHHV
jgi:hypothetical protein